MATADQITELRGYLGEPIPEDGTAADTLFSDTQVANWVDKTNSLNHAAVQGWIWKKAQFANLVDVVDGASQRKLSDLIAHADSMIATYRRESRGATAGRSRVGRIERSL